MAGKNYLNPDLIRESSLEKSASQENLTEKNSNARRGNKPS